MRLTMTLFSRKVSLVFYSALCCLLCGSGASAQEVQWDSTYRPAIYPSRVELFRSFHHSKKDIVLLGNSITFWGVWNEFLKSKHIKNRGIPGDITFGVLDRLDEIINGQPAKVFILIGINDISRNIPDSVIIQNYKRMVDLFKSGSPRTKIFLQTILPTNPSFNKLTAHYHKQEHIKHINTVMKRMAAEEHVGLIDLYSAFVDGEGNLTKELTFDGVHLTKRGYDKWIEILKHYL